MRRGFSEAIIARSRRAGRLIAKANITLVRSEEAVRAGRSICMLVKMILRRGLLGLGLVLLGCAGAGAQRLPGGVRPEHYALTITPDLAKARFAGSETIEVVLDKPTKTITLNAAEIEFVAVRRTGGRAGGGEQRERCVEGSAAATVTVH